METSVSEADRPAYLLVIARVTDRAKMAEYGRRLAELELYARHGGFYRFIGPPAADMENWGGESAVCAQFPSRAAAEAFWHSEEYQQLVKPIREGAGTFHVALFDGAPVIPGQAAVR
jgi:uncharacterized protein (DUF1330 family)